MLSYPAAKEPKQVHHEHRDCHRRLSAASAVESEAAFIILKRLSARAWATILCAYQRRQTVRALSALDNRALADIGIYRGQILAIAASAANGHDSRRGTEAESCSESVSPRRSVNDSVIEVAA